MAVCAWGDTEASDDSAYYGDALDKGGAGRGAERNRRGEGVSVSEVGARSNENEAEVEAKGTYLYAA
jgi:hypothetical protein